MKKMMVLVGLLALAVLVVGCTQGTLAGEATKLTATRIQDVRSCPTGCELMNRLNTAEVIYDSEEEDSSELGRSCDDLCREEGKSCINAEREFHISLVRMSENGNVERNEEGNTLRTLITSSEMIECSRRGTFPLRCRCY